MTKCKKKNILKTIDYVRKRKVKGKISKRKEETRERLTTTCTKRKIAKTANYVKKKKGKEIRKRKMQKRNKRRERDG